MDSPTRRIVAAAVVLDVVAVATFVVLGRRSHAEGGNPVTGALAVAAPFLLALAVGWVVARAWRAPTHRRTGLVVWPVTVAAGMLLRNLVFDRSTAASFVVVATIATGVLLLGWRTVARRIRGCW